MSTRNKISLSADETMLLLITKNWQHIDVPLNGHDTMSYIQACCDYRCNCEGADVFTIYISLCARILSANQFANILTEYNKNAFWERLGHEPRTLTSLMVSELASRRVTDLELDESLITGRSQ